MAFGKLLIEHFCLVFLLASLGSRSGKLSRCFLEAFLNCSEPCLTFLQCGARSLMRAFFPLVLHHSLGARIGEVLDVRPNDQLAYDDSAATEQNRKNEKESK